MHKNIIIFFLALVVMLLLGASSAGYMYFSSQLTLARTKADSAERRAAKLETEIGEIKRGWRTRAEPVPEAATRRNQNVEPKTPAADWNPRPAPLAQPPPPPAMVDRGFAPNPNREGVRAYVEMLGRNDAKLAELARDKDAAEKLLRLADLPAAQKNAELARMQQIGEAITIDNETIPLGTPGLDVKLRALMVEQQMEQQMTRGRGRFGGGGRRYEPPKQPETNNDQF